MGVSSFSNPIDFFSLFQVNILTVTSKNGGKNGDAHFLNNCVLITA
jgi:hypothetical protein